MKTFLTMLSAMLMTFAVIGCGGGTDETPADEPAADHEAEVPEGAGGDHEGEGGEEKPAEGVIVACGEGARKDSGELIPMAVNEGDNVLFGKWSGTEVTVDGEELLIMKESDVMGILS